MGCMKGASVYLQFFTSKTANKKKDNSTMRSLHVKHSQLKCFWRPLPVCMRLLDLMVIEKLDTWIPSLHLHIFYPLINLFKSYFTL